MFSFLCTLTVACFATVAELLDPDEAAEYLRTTRRHLLERCVPLGLAKVKYGRRVRFRREDLDAFIARQRQAPPSALALRAKTRARSS
jgi:excisionase family DNA binding protein